MSKKNKVTDNEVMEYLEKWRDNEGYSDLNLMLDRGLIHMAASIMSSSGAIDPSQHHDNKKHAAIEKEILRLGNLRRAYKMESKYFFNTVEIWIDPRTNEHAFVPYGDIDYFTSQDDLIQDGYKFDYGYDVNGKEYSKSVLRSK